LTVPTEFRVLDGKGGKVAALNRAFDALLVPSEAPVYVTLDDDFVPPRGWQEKTLASLAAFPKVGIVCPWPGDSAEWHDYVGMESVAPWQESGGLRTRLLRPWRHIPGCLLAFRRQCALDVGKTPESDRRYDIYEDCWRGRMAYKRGWRSLYVEAGPCKIRHYDDSRAYLTEKAADIDASQREADRVLRQYGLGDPLSWRARRLVARLLGRRRERANSAREALDRQEP
jgi:hypothetical protein